MSEQPTLPGTDPLPPDGIRAIVNRVVLKKISELQQLKPKPKQLLVLYVLYEVWLMDSKIGQTQLARKLSLLGHHEIWEVRLGEKLQSTLRQIRRQVEILRNDGIPVLSTPGKGGGEYGYYLASNREQIREYAERRRGEIEKTHINSINTMNTALSVFNL